jgi:hypothetical protein
VWKDRNVRAGGEYMKAQTPGEGRGFVSIRVTTSAGSGLDDVRRLRTLLPLNDLELDSVALSERLEA